MSILPVAKTSWSLYVLAVTFSGSGVVDLDAFDSSVHERLDLFHRRTDSHNSVVPESNYSKSILVVKVSPEFEPLIPFFHRVLAVFRNGISFPETLGCRPIRSYPRSFP